MCLNAPGEHLYDCRTWQMLRNCWINEWMSEWVKWTHHGCHSRLYIVINWKAFKKPCCSGPSLKASKSESLLAFWGLGDPWCSGPNLKVNQNLGDLVTPTIEIIMKHLRQFCCALMAENQKEDIRTIIWKKTTTTAKLLNLVFPFQQKLFVSEAIGNI